MHDSCAAKPERRCARIPAHSIAARVDRPSWASGAVVGHRGDFFFSARDRRQGAIGRGDVSAGVGTAMFAQVACVLGYDFVVGRVLILRALRLQCEVGAACQYGGTYVPFQGGGHDSPSCLQVVLGDPRSGARILWAVE